MGWIRNDSSRVGVLLWRTILNAEDSTELSAILEG
jgi:hypothetical protein